MATASGPQYEEIEYTETTNELKQMDTLGDPQTTERHGQNHRDQKLKGNIIFESSA